MVILLTSGASGAFVANIGKMADCALLLYVNYDNIWHFLKSHSGKIYD